MSTSLIDRQDRIFRLPTAYWGSCLYYALNYFYPCVVESQENYQKRTCRNRTIVLGPNGPERLSVPLAKGKNNQQSIQDVRLYNEDPWTKHHLQALHACYGKSPYFDFYIQEIESIYVAKKTLWELNEDIHRYVLRRFFDHTLIIEKSADQIIDLRQVDFYQAIKVSMVYNQVFDHKFDFANNLSILDAIFNTGPELRQYLKKTLLDSFVQNKIQ